MFAAAAGCLERQESAYSLSGTPCCCGAAASELLLCAVAVPSFVRLLCSLPAQYTTLRRDGRRLCRNASVLMPLARIAHILALGTAQAYNVDGSSPSGRSGRGPPLDLGRWPLDGHWEPQSCPPATMEHSVHVKRR